MQITSFEELESQTSQILPHVIRLTGFSMITPPPLRFYTTEDWVKFLQEEIELPFLDESNYVEGYEGYLGGYLYMSGILAYIIQGDELPYENEAVLVHELTHRAHFEHCVDLADYVEQVRVKTLQKITTDQYSFCPEWEIVNILLEGLATTVEYLYLREGLSRRDAGPSFKELLDRFPFDNTDVQNPYTVGFHLFSDFDFHTPSINLCDLEASLSYVRTHPSVKEYLEYREHELEMIKAESLREEKEFIAGLNLPDWWE